MIRSVAALGYLAVGALAAVQATQQNTTMVANSTVSAATSVSLFWPHTDTAYKYAAGVQTVSAGTTVYTYNCVSGPEYCDASAVVSRVQTAVGMLRD